MVQYEQSWRRLLIRLVFCHAADAGVVVGGPVVRQTGLQTQDQHRKPTVSAEVSLKETLATGEVRRISECMCLIPRV